MSVEGKGHVLEKVPEHGACFICGTENPRSLGVTWYWNPAGKVVAKITFTLAQQGPPGHVHGGASAAVLDEAMGTAVWKSGYNVASVNLNIDYRRPIPLDTEVTVVARMTDKVGRTLRARGEIQLPDGTVAVVGRGIYVEAPHLFQEGPLKKN